MKRARRIEFLLLHMTPKSLPFAIAILIAVMIGGPAYPQHGSSQSASGRAAWSELQQSMQSMHKAMSSLKSTGNNDEDFVRLMLPHHQAALDMAKTELLHGQDPQMRRLAQEIITDQQSEIELMQLWLRQHQPQNSQSGSSRPKAY
jgi:Domain of unknown function (DUF305)